MGLLKEKYQYGSSRVLIGAKGTGGRFVRGETGFGAQLL